MLSWPIIMVVEKGAVEVADEEAIVAVLGADTVILEVATINKVQVLGIVLTFNVIVVEEGDTTKTNVRVKKETVSNVMVAVELVILRRTVLILSLVVEVTVILMVIPTSNSVFHNRFSSLIIVVISHKAKDTLIKNISNNNISDTDKHSTVAMYPPMQAPPHMSHFGYHEHLDQTPMRAGALGSLGFCSLAYSHPSLDAEIDNVQSEEWKEKETAAEGVVHEENDIPIMCEATPLHVDLCEDKEPIVINESTKLFWADTYLSMEFMQLANRVVESSSVDGISLSNFDHDYFNRPRAGTYVLDPFEHSENVAFVTISNESAAKAFLTTTDHYKTWISDSGTNKHMSDDSRDGFANYREVTN